MRPEHSREHLFEAISFSSILDQISSAVIITDPGGNIIFWNRRAEEMYQYRSSEVIGSSVFKVVVPESSVDTARQIAGSMKDMGEWKGVFHVRRKDGSTFPAQVYNSVLRGTSGKIVGILGISEDISEKVACQNELRDLSLQSRTERSLRESLLENIPIGVAIVGLDGEVTETNAELIRVWGGIPSDLACRDGGELLAWDANTGQPISSEDWPLNRTLSGGETVAGRKVDIRKLSGRRTTVLMSSAPIMDAEDVMGAVAIFQDINEIQSMQRSLEEKARDLTTSNAELQQFAYVASHDLREPLRMISNYLGLIARRYSDCPLDEEGREYLSYALDGAKRMQLMINDLLAYSRLDSAFRPLAPTDMEEVLLEVMSNLDRLIEESGAVILHDPLPVIMADRTQMVHLFQNLIENAIKFRGEMPPRVEISVHLNPPRWHFTVTDNGIGIPSGQQERLFQMFQRLHTREDYQGTGIGLAMCKKIVERHGGEIYVDSQLGKGSTFHILLPIRRIVYE